MITPINSKQKKKKKKMWIKLVQYYCYVFLSVFKCGKTYQGFMLSYLVWVSLKWSYCRFMVVLTCLHVGKYGKCK